MFRLLILVLAVSQFSYSAFAMAAPQHDYSTFTNDQVRTRLLDACIMQLSVDPKFKDTLSSKCHCYASSTIKSLSQDEIDGYKRTQSLSGKSKEKAIAAQDKCGIK